jgi:hypothetical protein
MRYLRTRGHPSSRIKSKLALIIQKEKKIESFRRFCCVTAEPTGLRLFGAFDQLCFCGDVLTHAPSVMIF